MLLELFQRPEFPEQFLELMSFARSDGDYFPFLCKIFHSPIASRFLPPPPPVSVSTIMSHLYENSADAKRILRNMLLTVMPTSTPYKHLGSALREWYDLALANYHSCPPQPVFEPFTFAESNYSAAAWDCPVFPNVRSVIEEMIVVRTDPTTFRGAFDPADHPGKWAYPFEFDFITGRLLMTSLQDQSKSFTGRIEPVFPPFGVFIGFEISEPLPSDDPPAPSQLLESAEA